MKHIPVSQKKIPSQEGHLDPMWGPVKCPALNRDDERKYEQNNILSHYGEEKFKILYFTAFAIYPILQEKSCPR